MQSQTPIATTSTYACSTYETNLPVINYLNLILTPVRHIKHGNLTLTNHPWWRPGNRLIYHHFYTTGYVFPEFTIALDKIQDVVVASEKLTTDSNTQVQDANHEFSKHLVPGSMEHRIAHELNISA